MGLRAYVNENPMIGTGIAVVVLVIAVVLLASLRGPAPDSREAFYVDLETSEIFLGEPDNGMAPLSPAGNPSADADIFACGSCDDPDEWFLGVAMRDVEGDPDTGREARVQVSNDLRTWHEEEAWDRMMPPPPCPDGSQPEHCRP